MARYRQSMPGSMLLIMIIGGCHLLQPVKSFSTDRQLARLLGNLDDIDNDEGGEHLNTEELSHVSKRESKGTCTCTCETRPIVVSSANSEQSQPAAGATSGIVQHPTAKLQSENRVIESAALMRTATSATKDTKPKQQQQQTEQSRSDSRPPANQQKAENQKTASAQAAHYGNIVKVPPMHDYEMVDIPIHDVINNEPEMIAEEEEEVEDPRQQQQEPSRHENHADFWSHGSRYPWERLPNTMCFRLPCSSDRDCCHMFNICDRSAHVCTDCWYGSSCTSERDCCFKYKYCQREWKPNPITGKQEIVGGKCVSELR